MSKTTKILVSRKRVAQMISVSRGQRPDTQTELGDGSIVEYWTTVPEASLQSYCNFASIFLYGNGFRIELVDEEPENRLKIILPGLGG